MQKRSSTTRVCSGLAILAGSLTFMGTAQAVTLISEGFEGAGNVFGAGTYTYASTYTMPNLLAPGGGLQYLRGGNGIDGSVSTNIFTATGSPLSLLTGGITALDIDGGTVSYNLYAQFSTFRLQNDHGTLSVQFLDAGSSPLGLSLNIGGSAFVSGLGLGISGYGNPDFTDMRDWAADSLAGIVPAGARFASVQILEVKTAGGLAIDGYMDNVNFTIDVVPEPGSVALVALGAGLFALLRRRR
jgi:hypothetical protein